MLAKLKAKEDRIIKTKIKSIFTKSVFKSELDSFAFGDVITTDIPTRPNKTDETIKTFVAIFFIQQV